MEYEIDHDSAPDFAVADFTSHDPAEPITVFSGIHPEYLTLAKRPVPQKPLPPPTNAQSKICASSHSSSSHSSSSHSASSRALLTAREIIEAAKGEAEHIRAAAYEEIERRHGEAFALGISSGRDELLRIIEAFHRFKTDIREVAAATVVQIVWQLCTEIIGTELTMNRQGLLERTKRAIAGFGLLADTPLRIRVHPEDLAPLAACSEITGWVLDSDDALERGDLILELGDSAATLELRPGEHLRIVREHLSSGALLLTHVLRALPDLASPGAAIEEDR